MKVVEEEKEEKEEKSLEEQLAAKGIPMNIQSGRGLKGSSNGPSMAANSSSEKGSNSEDSQYLSEDSDGRTVLNLDKIVMEEANKNYWRNFSEQIGNGEHSLLFQLLS